MSNSFKKTGLFTILIMGLQFSTHAQGTNNPISKISIASPTAASLGKFGDVPVNYHTGIPQISIPIYTAAAGPLSLPISLSYHASGVKVQEPASWVGANWALNAGGVITRSVMGGPDEKGTNNGATQNHGHFSDYGYNSYYYYNPVAFSTTSGPNLVQFAQGYEDGEPDLYFFNFGGYSGKFYFRDDRTPVIVPEADLKIEPYFVENSNTSIQAFTVTTPDGSKYYFGNTPGLTGTAPIEITKPVTSGNGMSTANVISSWYLNKISSVDDVFAITLTYVPETYGYHTISMFPIDGNANASYPSFGAGHGYDLIKNIVQGVHLSQISFPNGAVNFVEAAAARTDLSDNQSSLITDAVNQTTKPLGAIQIYDSTSAAVLRKFNFSYNYFTDNTTAIPQEIANFAPALVTDKQRLRLDQVQEISNDGTVTKPPYNFTYFGEAVPRRLSFGMDHWGFANGSNSNTTPIPAYTQFASGTTNSFAGADRDTHWPAMRAGSLQQINYPTGGFSLFDFEPNTVYNTNSSVVNVTLANLTVHLYSQGNFTSTVPFVSDGSAMNIAFTNSTLFSASFSITNTSNVVVYSATLGNGQVSPTNAATLAAGTYNATLTCSSSAGINEGASAAITQYQTVTTNNTVTVGGNRIKTITHNDGVTANNVITSYSYNGDNNLSSGILYNRPVYVGILRNDFVQNMGSFTTSAGYTPNYSLGGCLTLIDASYFKSPSSIRPMASTQGNHIGYAQVKVNQTGNGYSLYKYYGSTGVPAWQANVGDIAVRTVNTQGCNTNAPSFPYPPVAFDYLRGELQYEAHYNEAAQKLKEATYTPTFVNSTIKTPAVITSQVSPAGGGNWTLSTQYDLTTAKKTQTQVTETVYNPADGNFLTTNSTTYFESPYHHEVTRTNALNSKGEALETKMKYAFDFRVSTCDNIADGYPQYTTDCNTCLTVYNNTRTATAPACTTSTCLTTAYLDYLHCLNNARVNYVSYRKTNFINITPVLNTFQTNHNTAKTAADAELKPILELQDFYQNAPIETTKWRNANLLGSTFSRYDYSTTPVGKIYLNKVQAINLQAASASFAPAVTNALNNAVIKDSRYLDETLVKFNNGNLVEITAKDGVTTSYLWGYNNVLPIAKAIGVNAATLSAAYTAAGGTIANLPALRTQPTLVGNGVQLNTYAYTPIIGMVTETDVNGKKITYEYDKLQRLLLARDFNNNILKQYDYQYQTTPPSTSPQWLATGVTQCKPCPANAAYITNIMQQQEKDNNPLSPTYNTLRYTDIGTSGSCVINADWQNTTTPLTCQKDAGNQNTGYQLQEQKDMNPCSPTFNTLRTITIANTTACPLPSGCNTGNCTGNDKKCINNVCETGLQVYTASVRRGTTNLWDCTYHYEWSNGTSSANFTLVSTVDCFSL
jgi:hypothetical protein